jgi:peptidoglycan/LPS O-acetylase OafA/YrhL
LKFTGIGQGWSLTVEECFYFLAPFILLWWKKFKLLMPILFLSIGSLLVLLFNHTNFYGLFHDFHFMMEYTFFGRCFEFFVGVGLAHWIKKNTCQISFPWTYAGLAVIILVTGVLSFIGTKGGFGIGQPIGIVLNNFILPFAIAALIYGLVIEKTWIQKIFSFRLIELLGKSSYAFYLIHAGIFFSAIHHYLTQNVFLIFLLLIILSIALYYLIEKPLNERWKSKKLINE